MTRTALVTGVSRRIGIGWAIAERLESDGFGVMAAGLRSYDARMPWGPDEGPTKRWPTHSVDFTSPTEAAELIPRVCESVGQLDVLVLSHAESVDSDILTTSVESFDRHMAVNARATWLMIKAFADQYESRGEGGRVIAMTSDHTAWNLPYGASKGAMDRIVLAAAQEFAGRGFTANVVNPGPTDTGWMSDEIRAGVLGGNLQPRIGMPGDVANLVSFLCSAEGGWINGQLLYSDGGRRA